MSDTINKPVSQIPVIIKVHPVSSIPILKLRRRS